MMTPIRFALLALPSLLGCGGRETWGTCANSECRAATVEKAFKDDAALVLQDIRSMEDPIEQAALIEQLAHAYPEQKVDICGVARSGSPAAERCDKMELRPHLYTGQKLVRSTDRDLSRAAPGPAESVPMRADLPLPWDEGTLDKDAARGDCGADNTCVSDRARGLAEEGKGREAAEACVVAWPEGSSAREECLFRVAETLVDQGGINVAREALALCNAAENIGRNCTQHVLIEAIPTPPAADAPDKASVEAAIAAAKFYYDNWPEPQRTFYTSFFWAVWTRDAYTNASSITGHLLTALPAEAAPHVRSAAAWKYLQASPDALTDLDRVAGYLKGRLAITGPLAAAPSGDAQSQPRVSSAQPQAFWTSDRSELEAQIPSIIFIGSGRRATSPNPDDDLRLAVIEAAARLTPPVKANFLVPLITSKQSDLVRWTAARLTATLYAPIAQQMVPNPNDALIKDALSYSAQRKSR